MKTTSADARSVRPSILMMRIFRVVLFERQELKPMTSKEKELPAEKFRRGSFVC